MAKDFKAFPLPEPFLHELRVRYGECDPQGIVFNANYLLYFDVAFTELWRAGVGPWQEMVSRGVDAVVAEARLEFRAPARFDDLLTLRTQVMRLGRSSITTHIDVLRDEELLVHGLAQTRVRGHRQLAQDRHARLGAQRPAALRPRRRRVRGGSGIDLRAGI